MVVAAALAAETRKHVANDPKCRKLGWMCVPLTVETYGNWEKEARETFPHLAADLPLGHQSQEAACCLNIQQA